MSVSFGRSAARRGAVLVVAAAAVLGSGVASAAPEQGGDRGRAAKVTGSGEFRLTFYPDDDIRSFTFDAQAVPYTRPIPGYPQGMPTDARGTVKIYHWVRANGMTIEAEAAVDCLSTSPGYAAFTAKITKTDEDTREWLGRRLGFSVQDAGRDARGRTRDRVGLSWIVSNMDQDAQGQWHEAKVGTCMAPAPFAPVTKGGFTVRHAELPEAPKS
ncbi:hypothetical protein ACIBF1_22860 [Spirillospora sp. NPDC050679]